MTLTRSLLVLACLLALGLTTPATAGDMNLEVQLLWGTDAAKSPNPKHKPIDPQLKKRLQKLVPLKWEHYFEETSKTIKVPDAASRTLQLSEVCELTVKNLGGEKVELTLVGRGKKAMTQVQPLPKGEILALGGNAPGETAWLIVLSHR